MKERLVWADIARIFAIYLVVVVHTSVLQATPFISELSTLILFTIAKAGVPLFIMLSGSLLLPKTETSAHFLERRFFRIVVPYLFWALIFILCLFLYEKPQTLPEYVEIISTGLRGFWFLPVLFSLYLLTPSLRVYVSHASRAQLLIPVAVWYLLVSLLPYMRNTDAFPLQARNDILSQVVDLCGYFLLGYLMVRSHLQSTRKMAFALIGIGLLWTILGTLYASAAHAINLVYLEYNSPSIVILSIGIFGLFLSLDDVFDALSTRTKRVAAEISRLVFGVYLLTTVVGQVLDRARVVMPHMPFLGVINSLLVALVIFVSALTLVFLLSQVPTLKKVVS
jgi:surface polysaccharide O-acyltransferase-like enzyme